MKIEFIDCDHSCGSCQDSKSCLSCQNTDLIQIKSDGSFGFCEALEMCHEKSLMISDSYCYNHSSIQHCNSLRKMSFADDCYPECPRTTFLQVRKTFKSFYFDRLVVYTEH